MVCSVQSQEDGIIYSLATESPATCRQVWFKSPLTWHWPDGWCEVSTNERKQVRLRETACKVWQSAAVTPQHEPGFTILHRIRSESIFVQKMHASALLMFDTKCRWHARPSQSLHLSCSSLISSPLAKSPPSSVPSSVSDSSIHLPPVG